MSKEQLDSIECKSKGSGTGAVSTVEYIQKVIHFDKFEIVVKLTLDGKFEGIDAVRFDKDFREFNQKISQKAFEYIDNYQPE